MASVHCITVDNVATITLDDPPTRNALDLVSAKVLLELFRDITNDRNVGAVVLQGANGTFSSGAVREVLADVGEDPAEDGRWQSLQMLYDTFVQLGRLPVPTVAAVRGAAVGAGVNLMLATDLRIVAHDARIVSGFLQIGIHPGGGHFSLLGRLAGREAAAAAGIFGEEISGTRARELGLAWEAVDDSLVESRAAELAKRAARDPALSRRAVASLRQELDPPGLPWSAALGLEQGPQMWSLRRRHTASPT